MNNLIKLLLSCNRMLKYYVHISPFNFLVTFYDPFESMHTKEFALNI